jgi:transcription elongation factor Elf1
MNAMPMAAPSTYSLADVVDETLAAALAGHDEPCLWCGGGPVSVASVDRWTGEVKLLCPQCGSELSGTVPRHRMEGRA